ncbi:MAG TPA: glutamine synthetase family protein [Blastocatellia bacterium]|nr:glutamine synthetase family protein [Blastocatellia bacterium]
MLTLDQLREMVAEEEIETVIVAFTDHYGRMCGKRYDAEMFVEDTVTHGTHGCDYLLTTDMEMEPVPGYKFANWELGYGDFHLVPDLTTLRVASWLEKTALVLCDVRSERTHEPVSVAPRSILRRQLDAAQARGFESFAASELEYYLFQNSYREAATAGFRHLEPAGWYLEDYHILQGTRTEAYTAAVRHHLKHSGVPVENSKGEWGLGQHELNIRYAEALEMADRHVVYKQCLKEVADQMGLSVTFMAKFAADRAGSSCHIHFSLWRDGRNLFAGENEFGPVRCSDEFRWFLGGWMAHVPDVMPFYAPTVNSYKRYVDASWAPTRLAWSYDNRTGGFRVVGHGESLRIECRIPGADCNPYLAYAAALASGLDGIRNKIEPPECFTGDIYAARHLPRVPYTLAEATDKFAASEFAQRSFGEDVVEHYAHFFRTEQAAFNSAVTDWERRRYFERI